ncbi:MAG TPA: ribonuclease P protein component [Candidatus Limnocylindria bacterium]|jgi:ribonuclease P protein component|nr:ribonuclease P protein component [Candidatus Limnocylindria bacterium]
MGAAPRSLALLRSRRLKKSSDFAQVRNDGQRIAQGCLILNWLACEASGTRVGVVTAKRVGDAVERNRARRLLREAFRHHREEIKQPTSIVLVARPSIVRQDFEGVRRDFLSALRRAGLRRSE